MEVSVPEKAPGFPLHLHLNDNSCIHSTSASNSCTSSGTAASQRFWTESPRAEVTRNSNLFAGLQRTITHAGDHVRQTVIIPEPGDVSV
ncbi:hypothetical protein FKM82_002755 [Ascaphus truei]